MLGESVHTVKKNTEASIIASKEINLDAMLTKLSTVEHLLSGRWSSGLPIIWIVLACRVNLSRILQT